MILRKDSLGPVVQRPIGANPALNFNPGFHISLFKNCFGIILPIVFGAFNYQIVVKKRFWLKSRRFSLLKNSAIISDEVKMEFPAFEWIRISRKRNISLAREQWELV